MEASTRITEEITVKARPAVVWAQLTEPARMRGWMGDADLQLEIDVDWHVGGRYVLRGFHIVPFEARGLVLAFDPCRHLRYTQMGSVSRLPDVPESYSTLDFVLRETAEGCVLGLEIVGFPTETIYHHLLFYWRGSLQRLLWACEGE